MTLFDVHHVPRRPLSELRVGPPVSCLASSLLSQSEDGAPAHIPERTQHPLSVDNRLKTLWRISMRMQSSLVVFVAASGFVLSVNAAGSAVANDLSGGNKSFRAGAFAIDITPTKLPVPISGGILPRLRGDRKRMINGPHNLGLLGTGGRRCSCRPLRGLGGSRILGFQGLTSLATSRRPSGTMEFRRSGSWGLCCSKRNKPCVKSRKRARC